MRKTLIILRHGKAEPARGGQEDHERPLAERGRRDSRRMGEYLAAQGIRPDKIVCSAAVRTRQTLEYLFPLPLREGVRGRGVGEEIFHTKPPTLTLPLKGGGDISVEYSDALYLATDNQLLKTIAVQPDEIHSLMLIGHNPGLHELCVRLAAEGDRQDVSQLTASFPTCALAVITLSDWREKRGALKRFVTPKLLPDSL